MQKDGGWVFISHSHLDVDIVRVIRNQLEAQGFEPLMFYLKCLTDEDEIESLIRREIDEREWFIYVDSDNAKRSRWVKTEREYIASLSGKKVFTIDIRRDITEQLNAITRQLKVFIACSHSDRAVFEAIKQALLKKDYLVFDDRELPVGTVWREQIAASVQEAAREGLVLLLVSEASLASAYVETEVRYAIRQGGRVLPVYIGGASLDASRFPELLEIAGCHVDAEPTAEQIEGLIARIEHGIRYFNADFTLSHGFQSARTIEYPYVSVIPDFAFWDCKQLESVYIPPSVTDISDKAFREEQDVLIVCDKGSRAEEYCLRHHRRYELRDA